LSLLLLLGIAVSLALDASAVAIATSIRLRRASAVQTLRMALAFGGFQFLMPILGWLAGQSVAGIIQNVDHWVAFSLLAVVGGHMLWEAFQPEQDKQETKDPTTGWTLLALSVATSIDALAVGLSFSLLGYAIWLPSVVIGIVTAILTALALQFGCRLGQAFGRRLDAAGGLVLIAIGLKILLEHLH
jgi:manganese efflux pump family protein